MRTRRLIVALAAGALTAAALVGTAPGAGTVVVAAAAAPEPPAPSAGLRTGAPAPMATVDSVARSIAATTVVPESGVGRVGRDELAGAVEWFAIYLAQAHGDPRWLCAGSDTGSPTRRFATSALLRRLAGPAGERLREGLEPRLTRPDGPDCSAVSWAAPGVAVGPQRLALSPGRDGDELRVVYSGRFGYRLVAADGREQPWGGDFHATYGLVRHGREWRLNSATAAGHVLGPGWPDPLPLPHGFAASAAAPRLPGADAASLTAVRSAVRAAQATDGTWRYAHDSGGHLRYAEGPVAFARGDALLRQDDGTVRRYLEHGATELTAPASPGAPRWRALDPAARPFPAYEVDEPSPFVNLAVVALADAAAAVACPAPDMTSGPAPSPSASHPPLARCYAVRVPLGVAAHAGGVTARFGWGHVVRGQVWLTMTVGVDAAGRVSYLHRVVESPAPGGAARVAVTATLDWFPGAVSAGPERASAPWR